MGDSIGADSENCRWFDQLTVKVHVFGVADREGEMIFLDVSLQVI